MTHYLAIAARTCLSAPGTLLAIAGLVLSFSVLSLSEGARAQTPRQPTRDARLVADRERTHSNANSQPIALPAEFAVETTYNDQPFQVRTELIGTKPGFRIYRLSYPSPIVTSFEANNTIPADYYLPDDLNEGAAPRPAVICLHILNGNFELVRMLCSSLAARGVPAVMFKLPYYGERALPDGMQALHRNGRLFVEALPQGIHDARRTFDVLAARPEVDPRHIGVAGISLGGIVGAAAAGSDLRFDRSALLLAGGDLLRQVVHHSRESSELSKHLKSLPDDQRIPIEQAIVAIDPLTHAPNLRKRAQDGKVLMINADQDEVIPPAASIQLAQALGIEKQVVWLEGLGHYTAVARLPEIMRRTADFFAQDLPAGAVAPTTIAAPRDPLQLLARVIADAGSMLARPPSDGRCHLVELEAVVADPQGKAYEGQLRYIRGADQRFRLQCKVPVLGAAVLGDDGSPWMANERNLYRGKVAAPRDGSNGEGTQSPLADAWALVDQPRLAKARMIAGAMSTLALAPQILDQVVRVTSHIEDDDATTLHITPIRKPEQGAVDMRLQPDGKTPATISFTIQGFQGTITVQSWQSNSVANDALFQPPDDLPTEYVEAADLQRIFASFINFAGELLE